MKNFKHYFTEEMMSINIAAGWITPDGKKINVPFGSHDQYVKDHKDMFGITDEDIKNLEEFTLIKKLAILNGAVRFHLYIPYSGAKPIATVGATPKAFKIHKNVIDDIMIGGRVTNYDVYLTAEDGEFLGAKSTSIFEQKEDEDNKEDEDI